MGKRAIASSRMNWIQDWRTWAAASAIAIAAVIMVKGDLARAQWVSELSLQGSPPPSLDPSSPTGYELGQRHFLGLHERGETYRWIAATQDLVDHGLSSRGRYNSDNLPEGRPFLPSALYTIWLAIIGGIISAITGASIGAAIEHAALWEPIMAHMLALLGLVFFVWRRYGGGGAAVAGIFFALYPYFSIQFLPGTLSPLPWALLLASYALASALPRRGAPDGPTLSIASAVAAGLALGFDPTFGFSAVLILAIVAAVQIAARPSTTLPCGRWALVGAAVATALWLLDGNPLNPAEGELRYNHPLYAAAWLGMGLFLSATQTLRNAPANRKRPAIEIVAALALGLPLLYTQASRGYLGWLYPSGALKRLASSDETIRFPNLFSWSSAATSLELVFVLLPFLLAVAALFVAFAQRRSAEGTSLAAPLAILVCCALAAFFHLRWSVVVSLLAIPIILRSLAGGPLALRRAGLASGILFVFALLGWSRSLPDYLEIPNEERGPSVTDLNALAHRHFAYWLATHTPEAEVAALASPELSDSLIFHGGCRTLMSTAWESYLGQVAASRLLSAPESTEVEAIIESRQITHVILPSWDPVLPLLVIQPALAEDDTLYDRLDRWLLPPFLRAIPYQLPSIPGFADQKLAVFKVTPFQNEALALARLGEYFVEMRRNDPAGLVGQALAEAFPEDPNAILARAFIYANNKDAISFRRVLDKLAEHTLSGLVPRDWDRRAARAIILALGNRHDLARGETQACVDTMDASTLYDLTPLQAYRFDRLLARYQIEYPSPELAAVARALFSEYGGPQ